MFLVSEHLRTAKIPCKERVRKYRVHKIGVFSEKKRVSEHLGCPNIKGKYGISFLFVQPRFLICRSCILTSWRFAHLHIPAKNRWRHVACTKSKGLV